MKINKNLIQKHIKISPDQIEFVELNGKEYVQIKIYTLDSILIAAIAIDCSFYKIKRIQSKYGDDSERTIITTTLYEEDILPGTVFVDILRSVIAQLKVYKDICNKEHIDNIRSLENELDI